MPFETFRKGDPDMRLAPLALALATLLLPATALAQQNPIAIPTPVPAVDQFSGLNLLLTRQRLDEINAAVNAGNPLAIQACQDAIAAADSALGTTPNPIVGVFEVPSYYSSQRAVQQQLAGQIRTDGRACLALAWGYALTGQQSYADACKGFLTAWEQNLTTPQDGAGEGGWNGIVDWLIGETGGDTSLVAHYSLPLFIYAFDILDGFGQISDTDRGAFRSWLAPFVSYRLSEERFENNHQNWQVLFMGAAAHVTADQHLMDMAVAYYRDGMHHQQIAADGAMWRELARGQKAATYTLMALEAMVQFVTIAANHGVTDLEDVQADGRDWDDSLALDYVTHFHSSHVSSHGGTLRNAFDSLRDFLNDPAAWTSRFQPTIRSATVDGPAAATDWGWVFEVANAWWYEPSYQPFLAGAPYGTDSTRAYTLEFSTLLYRPF